MNLEAFFHVLGVFFCQFWGNCRYYHNFDNNLGSNFLGERKNMGCPSSATPGKNKNYPAVSLSLVLLNWSSLVVVCVAKRKKMMRM